MEEKKKAQCQLRTARALLHLDLLHPFPLLPAPQEPGQRAGLQPK